MRIVITGSIATDHLMTFPGRFADSIVLDKLDKISLSFLVDELEVRRGGVAANIAFGMGVLGLNPILVGRRRPGLRRLPVLAGAPRRGHRVRARLRGAAHGALRVHHRRATPTRSPRSTPGRCRRPATSSWARSSSASAAVDLVLIGANDPEAMMRHTEECRYRRHPVRRRPVPAAGPDARRRDPAARRRCRLPVHQRVRGRAHRAEDRAGAATRSSTGWAPGSPPSGPNGVRIERQGEDPIQVRHAQGDPQGRPDRRRRRLPGRLPRRAGLGAVPASGAPRSARCWPRT